MMYNVKGKTASINVMTLDEAMRTAKLMNEFVTITGKDYEVVGMFGVDTVADGKCPDGKDYTWTMRRDETHRSWKKKST